MTNNSLNGHDYGDMTHFKFCDSYRISEMGEPINFRLIIQIPMEMECVCDIC